MELKPGYKQTEVGVIPEDWQTPTLGRLTVLMTNGFVGTATTHYANNENGILYIQGYNIEANSFNFHGIKFVTEEFHKAHMKSCLRGGDLLTVQTGEVGLTTIVPESLAGSNCHALVISRFNQKRVSPAFISYYLNSKPGRSRLKLIETGTTMKHLNVGDMLQFVIPLPPTKTEQEAIAEALSDADALIESLEHLSVKKRLLKQGVMQELLTGKKRLPGFSGKWDLRRFGSALEFQVGFPFSSSFFNQDGQGIRLVKNRDLKSDDQVFHYSGKYSEDFLVQDGDVLVGMDGDFLPCLWSKGPALLNQRVGRVVPLTCLDRVFAFHFLIEPLKEIENATSSTTVKHLSHGDIKDIEKPLPKVDEQTAIATILCDMDAEIDALGAKLAKARSVKQGMMQQLLTGKVRLV